MQQITEILDTYRGLARTGSSPYNNWGLGAMTEVQRKKLFEEGKITTEEGSDCVAVFPCGIVEYSQRGSEVIKRFNFKGMTLDLIQFKVSEAEGIIKGNKDKLISSGIVYLPKWNCIF